MYIWTIISNENCTHTALFVYFGDNTEIYMNWKHSFSWCNQESSETTVFPFSSYHLALGLLTAGTKLHYRNGCSLIFPSIPENKNAVTPLMVLILGTGGFSYLSHLSYCISTYSSICNIFQFTSWNGRNKV